MFSIVIHPNKHTIMKKLIFTAVILVSCLTFKNANAQIHFSVGVNIGSQPDWGPVGYDHAAYYYIPDVDGYYDVSAHQYIYLENNVWVHRAYLPARYHNYDLYHGYKVVINDRNPWLRNSAYRTRYAGFRGRHDQNIIRDSHDARYRNHWRGGPENHGGGYGRGEHGRGPRGGDQHGRDQHDRGQHGGGEHGGDHHDRGHGGDQHDKGHHDH